MRQRILVLISLLPLLLAANVAVAEWRIDIESKIVNAGESGVTLAVTAYWDMEMFRFGLPLVVREVDAGSFWTGALPVDTLGGAVVGVTWNWQAPSPSLYQEVRPVVPLSPCATDGDVGYDAVTPDHLAIWAILAITGAPAEPTGREIVYLTFDVTGAGGDFEFDTACFATGLNTILMIDKNFVDHGPQGENEVTFNKGVITIIAGANDPPSITCSSDTTIDIDQALSFNVTATDDGNIAPLTMTAENVPAWASFTDNGGGSGTFSGTPGCDDPGRYTVRFIANDGQFTDVCLVAITVNEDGEAPVITSCPENMVVDTEPGECVATVEYEALATDNCPASLIITYDPPSGSPFAPGSPTTVTVTATDGNSNTDQCSFTVTVQDIEDPCTTCLEDTEWQCCLGPLELGDVAHGGGDTTVIILRVTKDGDPIAIPAGMTINPDGTNFVWDPGCDPAIEGKYVVTLQVDDGYYQTKCFFIITMYGPYEISINGGSCTEVLPGQNVTVNVSIDDGHFPPGAFDLLITYDASVINFLSAQSVGDLADYWEYFTYRFGPFGNNCGTGCPSGYIRLIGIYDMHNGVEPTGINLEGDFVELTFRATTDPNFRNQCFWLDWAWSDCGDNLLSDLDGDVALMATDIADILPEDDCLLAGEGRYELIPCVLFNRGCICIVSPYPPWITCPEDVEWQCCLGPLELGDVAHGDDDGDLTTVTILQVAKDGDPIAIPTGLTINPDGTNLVWDPGCDPAVGGEYVVTLQVDDGYHQTECSFTITMHGPYELSILGSSCAEVMPGYRATIIVSIDHGHFPIGGFDLLISYDNGGGINFLQATAIGDLTNYWEYFTYRFSWLDNCGGGCPTGYIRLVGIYDMPNGDTPAGINLEGDFVELIFQTTQDLNFIGQCFWLDWAWLDCGDNTLSDLDGDALFMAMDILTILPDEDCLEPDKYIPVPCIIFNRGCICLVPPEDERGDINLNGVANEIADAVLFANSFIYGWQVLGYPDDPYWENRKLATDINNDGVSLTVADLVYLIRIITGDASPYPESGEGRIAPPELPASVDWRMDNDQLVVDFFAKADAGAVLLAFDHHGADFGDPSLSDRASSMTVISHNNGAQLRVLLYGMERSAGIPAGEGTILTVPIITADPGLVLAEAEAADYYGNMMTVEIGRPTFVPKEFALFQNIPNPFNATTRIDFNLPEASEVTLAVYDVLGRRVATLVHRYLEAGAHHIAWNARDDYGTEVASGIYFYRITTAAHQASRKMILLK